MPHPPNLHTAGRLWEAGRNTQRIFNKRKVINRNPYGALHRSNLPYVCSRSPVRHWGGCLSEMDCALAFHVRLNSSLECRPMAWYLGFRAKIFSCWMILPSFSQYLTCTRVGWNSASSINESKYARHSVYTAAVYSIIHRLFPATPRYGLLANRAISVSLLEGRNLGFSPCNTSHTKPNRFQTCFATSHSIHTCSRVSSTCSPWGVWHVGHCFFSGINQSISKPTLTFECKNLHSRSSAFAFCSYCRISFQL